MNMNGQTTEILNDIAMALINNLTKTANDLAIEKKRQTLQESDIRFAIHQVCKPDITGLSNFIINEADIAVTKFDEITE